MECRESVSVADAICHLMLHLREFDYIVNVKGCRFWVHRGDKVNEIHRQLDLDELHVLAAHVEHAVDHRQEHRRIGRVGRVVDLVPLGVVEA